MKDRESVTTNGRAAFYAAVWNDLREAAMDKGWALALHGSLASDMDIMAMPWTDKATTDREMVEAIKSCFTDPNLIDIKVSDMPNNRRVFTIPIWADFYLDINVIHNYPKIITLCGSTRFYEEFDKANFAFTLDGWIVLNIGCNTKSDNDLFQSMPEQELVQLKNRLDQLHFAKIRMSDAVFIINKDGYIGESTRRELDYAKSLGKEIIFLEPESAQPERKEGE